jgi:hypothetical protein
MNIFAQFPIFLLNVLNIETHLLKLKFKFALNQY